jgi:hypothetical protein
MQWSDISFAPTSRTLRQFAGIWVVFFGAMACWQAFACDRTTLGIFLGALAVVVGPLGLVYPQAVRWIYVGWMILAFPIGWTLSRLLLAVLFFGLFTPVGFLFKLMGRDLLQRKARPDLPTYWTVKPMPANVSRYFRQY